MSILMNNNSTFLFQGDSVTDCGRSSEPDSPLGNGYVKMISEEYSAYCPGKNLGIFNRGIGGNKVTDLQKRWQEDCLDLKPDVLSILVGINDCAAGFAGSEPVTTEEFEAGYGDLLKRVKEALPETVFVLCEPFLLPVDENQRLWRSDLDIKIQVVRKLANEHGAILIPLDDIFTQESAEKGPAFLTTDGVHPNQAGHALISKAWMEAVLAF